MRLVWALSLYPLYTNTRSVYKKTTSVINTATDLLVVYERLGGPCYDGDMRHAKFSSLPNKLFFCFFLIVCFTSYFMFSIAVLPHSPRVVYYHLLLRRETRIPRVAPFSFRIGIWDLFVHRGQKSYTPTAFGKLWTTPGVRCMKHASS